MSADVTRVVVVEPEPVGRQIARRRIEAAPFPVDFVGPDAEELRLASESIDHVLVTWTLCTIPDVDRALHEALRVLAPGGRCTSSSTAATDPRVAGGRTASLPCGARCSVGVT